MLIGKTTLNKDTLIKIGRSLFGTKRTHKNDLVAAHYMIDNDINEFDAIRNSQDFDSLIKYTFVWAMPVGQYYKFADALLDTTLKRISDDDGTQAYVCFFTADIRQWCNYCKDITKPAPFRDEIRAQLSLDGYSLLFKETRRLK